MARRHLPVPGLLFAAAMLAAVPALAQSTDRYDPAAESTVSGTVVHVVSAVNADGSVGVHLEVKTDQGLVNVSVGPAMFIGMNNLSFFADDRVTATGAYVTSAGKKVLWTRIVTKGGQSLTLRDEKGTPRWPNATPEDPDGCGVAHAPIW